MAEEAKNPKRVMVVDDEPAARTAMRMAIEAFDELNIIAEIGDGRSAIDAINKLQPDIVFLDIEMPEVNGFKVAEATKSVNYQLVFVTAYDQYALDAFDTNAIDYLLKPVRPQLLEKCLRKLLYQESVLLERLERQKTPSTSLILSDGRAMRVLEHSHILYIEGIGRYRRIHLTAQGQNIQKVDTVLSDTTLDDFDLQLSLRGFMRIHRSYLINLQFVVRVFSEARRYFVGLENTSLCIPISRSHVTELKDRL